MKIIVEDTNIIIDLFKTGLLSFCMELKLEFHTTRYVVAEILESSQSAVLIGMINNGQLLIDDFVGEEYERLIKYIDECNGENNLSEADCSVLLLAKRLGCRLLTSDQKLKRKAKEHGVEVNGFLWLTDLLVKEHIVSGATMINHLTDTSKPIHELRKMRFLSV